MPDCEWLACQLIDTEYVENGPQLDKCDCQKMLDDMSESTGKSYLLVVNVNVGSGRVYYDYVLYENDKNEVRIEE